MTIQKLLQKTDKFEIEKYKKPSDRKNLIKTHITYSGSPHKHPYDSKKMILLVDPYHTSTFYYEFRKSDIAFIEELPSLANLEGDIFTIVQIKGESRRYPEGKITLKDEYGDKIVYPDDFSDPIDFGDYFESIDESKGSDKYLLNDEDLEEGMEFKGNPDDRTDVEKAKRMADDNETEVTIDDVDSDDEEEQLAIIKRLEQWR